MNEYYAFIADKVSIDGTRMKKYVLRDFICRADTRGQAILKASDELKRQYGGFWSRQLAKCIFFTREELKSRGIDNPY